MVEPAKLQEYRQLLEQYNAVIYARDWDYERAAVLAAKMSRLVRGSPRGQPLTEDEQQAYEMMAACYQKRLDGARG
jgi:hypothetical protein